ncbi:Eco29kI family restriction endonuclease [Actinokineospora sp. G85]|uniref:Eco29kI family restriction endonuclease n=1 Tax=Actinokineospora sp. G85 TaxID=3406626 RepID=UPI003C791BB2
MPVRSEPFNPLDLEHLGESVGRHLLLREKVALKGLPKMLGAGVYAIYYTGDHELYQPISASDGERPIYIGKAIAKGGRKGNIDQSRETEALWKRLQEHAKSLTEAEDLDAADFVVRYLVVVDVFIPLAEQVMIQRYRPVWNQVVDGFGNHNPGSGRAKQARSRWDELHPGRPWAAPEVMPKPAALTREQLRGLVKRFFAGGESGHPLPLEFDV